jgi:hypothetical protein
MVLTIISSMFRIVLAVSMAVTTMVLMASTSMHMQLMPRKSHPPPPSPARRLELAASNISASLRFAAAPLIVLPMLAAA